MRRIRSRKRGATSKIARGAGGRWPGLSAGQTSHEPCTGTSCNQRRRPGSLVLPPNAKTTSGWPTLYTLHPPDEHNHNRCKPHDNLWQLPAASPVTQPAGRGCTNHAITLDVSNVWGWLDWRPPRPAPFQRETPCGALRCMATERPPRNDDRAAGHSCSGSRRTRSESHAGTNNTECSFHRPKTAAPKAPQAQLLRCASELRLPSKREPASAESVSETTMYASSAPSVNNEPALISPTPPRV